MESRSLSTPPPIYNLSTLKVNTCRLAIGIINFSTKLSENKLNVSEEFLFWFSFTDGEGNFSITLDRTYIIFRFKINLHIDDLQQVLNVIKSNLNIGRIVVEESRSSCAFVVQNFSELKDVLCPIFINFPLHTSNKLDFQKIYIWLFLLKLKVKMEIYLI